MKNAVLSLIVFLLSFNALAENAIREANSPIARGTLLYQKYSEITALLQETQTLKKHIDDVAFTRSAVVTVTLTATLYNLFRAAFPYRTIFQVPVPRTDGRFIEVHIPGSMQTPRVSERRALAYGASTAVMLTIPRLQIQNLRETIVQKEAQMKEALNIIGLMTDFSKMAELKEGPTLKSDLSVPSNG